MLASSFIMGGFECSTHRRSDGQRLDLLAATGHDVHARSDYGLLREVGIRSARDGVRWHLIERAPGEYDFASLVPMVRAARAAGIQVFWDLCHYGWPDDVDIWSPEFVRRFARFAAATAEVIAAESGAPPLLCPVNEISFWAWAGGEVGIMNPAGRQRGPELKRQLVRATIAAIDAIRRVAPQSRFLYAEPAIHVDAGTGGEQEQREAELYRLAQFEALDMVSGRLAPDLGGTPEHLDIVGVNFYPENQWYLGGRTIPLGHHAYRPLSAILLEVHQRYGRPMIVAETGAEGSARPAWMHYVLAEAEEAIRLGVPLEAVCLYPVLNTVGWDNGRICPVGLFSAAATDGSRALYEPLARVIEPYGEATPARRKTGPVLFGRRQARI